MTKKNGIFLLHNATNGQISPMKPSVNHASKADVLISIDELMSRWGRGKWAFTRWGQDESLDFPRPIVIRKKRYYKLREIEQFESRFTARPWCSPKAAAA